MEAHITGTQATFVKRIAELYLKGDIYVVSPGERGDLTEELGMTPENRQAVLTAIEAFGIIGDVDYSSDTGGFAFEITSKAVQAARDIQRQEAGRSEPRSIVAELQSTAKANPVWAWVIVGFVILTAAVTLVNQVWQLVDRFVK